MGIPEIFTAKDAVKLLQQHYERPDGQNKLTDFGTPTSSQQVALLNKQYPLVRAATERVILWHQSEIYIPTAREVLFYNIETAAHKDEFRRRISTVAFGRMESVDEMTDEFLNIDVRAHLSNFYGKKMNGTGSYTVWYF